MPAAATFFAPSSSCETLPMASFAMPCAVAPLAVHISEPMTTRCRQQPRRAALARPRAAISIPPPTHEQQSPAQWCVSVSVSVAAPRAVPKRRLQA